MNIIQLQYFVDVGELGSFTEAAKKNRMTIPAISISISQLEEELGASLFVRSRKGVTPTIEGKTAMKHAISILDKLEVMKQDISHSKNKSCDTIMIATTPGMVPNIIRATLEYQKMYPSINIEMIEGDTNLVLKQVKNGQAEIGFVSLPEGINDAELAWKPMIEDRAILDVHKGSRLRIKEAISSNEIKDETIVLYNDPYIRMVADMLHLEDPSNMIALISNNVESLFQMVIKGNAVTIATDHIVHSLPEHIQNELVMIPIHGLTSHANYLGRITRKNTAISDHIEQFTEFLSSQMDK